VRCGAVVWWRGVSSQVGSASDRHRSVSLSLAASMSVKHGRPVSVQDIVCTNTCAASGSPGGACKLGDSVRTVGRLKAVVSVETVVVEDEGCELEVDVSLSTPCHFKAGAKYQFIGELEDRRNSLGQGVSQPTKAKQSGGNASGLPTSPVIFRPAIPGKTAADRCTRESAIRPTDWLTDGRTDGRTCAPFLACSFFSPLCC